MLVAVCGIILATIIGFIVGVMRLSKNWLVSKVAEVYIEVMRNIPLLIQIFIWYKVVLAALPHPRNAISVGGTVFLSNRGITIPKFIWGDGAWLIGVAAWLPLPPSGCCGAGPTPVRKRPVSSSRCSCRRLAC
jgi:general L-amino acid transport system permease protein